MCRAQRLDKSSCSVTSSPINWIDPFRKFGDLVTPGGLEVHDIVDVFHPEMSLRDLDILISEFMG